MEVARYSVFRPHWPEGIRGVTYRDDWRFFGRDEEYRFRLTKGELTDSLFQSISDHLKRPVTDRVPPC